MCSLLNFQILSVRKLEEINKTIHNKFDRLVTVILCIVFQMSSYFSLRELITISEREYFLLLFLMKIMRHLVYELHFKLTRICNGDKKFFFSFSHYN